MIDTKFIKDYGKEMGIDAIRITTAQPFRDAEEKILAQKNEGLFLGSEHWEEENVYKFCDVHEVLPQAKSIIAVCQCYLTDERVDFTEPGRPHGLIARYTWRNHYLDLRKKLRTLAQYINKRGPTLYRVYSNGPVAEKPIALRSGIGYYGKHTIVINRTYGSWIVLGEIITDINLEPDEPLDMDCGDCRQCLDACPTKAIIRPYIIDRRKCIQALTNWYGVIPGEIARVWGNRLYGCTTCQEVCPANKQVKSFSPRTHVGYVGSSLPLLDIMKMNESEYREKYANNQITAYWINFTAIRRNALLALGNIKDRTTLPLLRKFSKDRDQVIAKTAQWAIANFLP